MSVGPLALCGWLLALPGLVIGILVLASSRRVRALRDLLPARAPGDRPGGAAAGAFPTLSVVVTARDEAAGIEATVRGLLTQRCPGLEVIVVDDRSTDGTAEILDRIAAEAGARRAAPPLLVLHNDALPQGWLGKCHACHLGAGRARGGWILFTDGDVALAEDDLLARVVSYAEDAGLDHVAVLPDLGRMPSLQTGLVAAFGQMFLLGARAFEMERDLRRGGAGVGAFNLMRRAAYERVGGHRLLRMDPADDFKLGRLLKESGARQRIFLGVGLVRCPWHRGTFQVIRGLEKNLFSGFGYSLAQLVAFTLFVLLTTFGPAVAAGTATLMAGRAGAIPAGPLAAAWAPVLLQATLLILGYATEGRRHGYAPLTPALLHPLSLLLLTGAAWNSAVRTLLQGGVRWRDTFYPLDVLRRGLVPPGAGRALGADAHHGGQR